MSRHGRSATTHCYACGCLISYEPHRVPSVRIDGVREPICRACAARANPERVARDLDPIQVLLGAYDPIEEGEL